MRIEELKLLIKKNAKLTKAKRSHNNNNRNGREWEKTKSAQHQLHASPLYFFSSLSILHSSVSGLCSPSSSCCCYCCFEKLAATGVKLLPRNINTILNVQHSRRRLPPLPSSAFFGFLFSFPLSFRFSSFSSFFNILEDQQQQTTADLFPRYYCNAVMTTGCL